MLPAPERLDPPPRAGPLETGGGLKDRPVPGELRGAMPPPNDLEPPPDGAENDLEPPPDGAENDLEPPPDGAEKDRPPADPPDGAAK